MEDNCDVIDSFNDLVSPSYNSTCNPLNKEFSGQIANFHLTCLYNNGTTMLKGQQQQWRRQQQQQQEQCLEKQQWRKKNGRIKIKCYAILNYK